MTIAKKETSTLKSDVDRETLTKMDSSKEAFGKSTKKAKINDRF